MQYLLVFPILLCVFCGVACLVLCGTKSALFVSIAVIILRYDYKLALNTVANKLFVVGTCKP